MSAKIDKEQLHSFISSRLSFFDSIYESYLQNHVISLLQFSKTALRAIKISKFYHLCWTVVSEKQRFEEFESIVNQSTVGKNLQIISWMITIIRSISHFFPSEDKLLSKSYFAEEIQRFSTIINNPTKFDDHTSVILSWWLSQLLEILSLGLCIRKLSPENKLKLCNSYNVIFDVFMKNSAFTIYVLSGQYLEMCSTPVLNLNSKQSLKTNVSKLFHELQEKNRQHSHNIRKLLYESKKRAHSETSSDNSNVGYYNNFLDKTREKMLLEPNHHILSALCRLVLVKQEDEDMSQSILRYCGAKNCLVNLIKTSINQEVASTNTFEVLFRGESVATKLMSSLFFSKWGGKIYLEQVIQPLITELNSWELSQDSAITEENMQKIATTCEQFLKRIYNSTHLFPPVIRLLLRHAQQEVAQKFPEMKQKVIGGFFFLRFVCPALVSPVRFGLHLQKNSNGSQRAIILVSRVLQCIANGTEFDISKGDLTKLNQVIEVNKAKMLSYFDTLADISSIDKDINAYKFEIQPGYIHSDFRTIVQILHSLYREVKEIVDQHFPETLPYYLNFLNLGNPSTIKQVIDCNNPQYNKTIYQISGMFGANVMKHLLGFEKSTASKTDNRSIDDCKLAWYTHKSQNFNKIFRISSSLQTNRDEMHNLLDSIFYFHDYATSVYSNWSEGAHPKKKMTVLRKITILNYLHNATQDCEVAFNRPEVWESWTSFLVIVERTLEILLKDALSDFVQTQLAKDALCLMIVQMRWTISRLISLQGAERKLIL